MKKDEFNSRLRECARSLSPKTHEQETIAKIYKSIKDILGDGNCLQIGSYPRFTSVTPIHDLDVLYLLGNWSDNNHNPTVALQSLHRLLDNNYQNPTSCDINISIQTHSVTILFSNKGEEVVSVDIVPAYIFMKNEYHEDTYKVPEIMERRHSQRGEYYQNLSKDHKEMNWIHSDPNGYIQVASDIDKDSNGEFRKSVKFIKKWKNNLENKDSNLKLKSFHIEQIITGYFRKNPKQEIFDVIFKFFIELPQTINNPNKIADRVNADKFIDDYLSELNEDQKNKIKQASDGFLIKLEQFSEEDLINDLLEIYFYKRTSSEEFLFDKRIPTLLQTTLCINGWIQKDNTNFRRLSLLGYVDNRLKIKFESFMGPSNSTYKWKVKNDNSSNEPRGEITDSKTKNGIETTAYKGNHYVECYAIVNDVCVARARQSVVVLH